MFLDTFFIMFDAIFRLFLITLAAGILVRKGIVSQEQIKGLSHFTVTVLVPCLILVKTVTVFNPSGFKFWWLLPLAGILMVLLGLGSGYLLFARQLPAKNHWLPMGSMQNAVYIALPIGKLLYPGDFDLFALYCFLLILGYSPILWSVGKVLISGDRSARISPADFITPPLTATLLSMVLVFTGLSSWIPTSLLNATEMLSQATVPLAVFILGATLGSISLTDIPPLSDIARVALVKYACIPLAAYTILRLSGLGTTYPLVSDLIMIQASAPPATNLILMVKNYGGDAQANGSMMMIQYFICMLAMPLWMTFWQLTR
ncbi:MAG: AEC family transporter [Pseudomonadota bacterium]